MIKVWEIIYSYKLGLCLEMSIYLSMIQQKAVSMIHMWDACVQHIIYIHEYVGYMYYDMYLVFDNCFILLLVYICVNVVFSKLLIRPCTFGYINKTFDFDYITAY